MTKLIKDVNYKIYDDFLTKEEYETFITVVTSGNFPWFYSNDILGNIYTSRVDNELDNYLFTHTFYDSGLAKSQHFNMIVPFVEKLNMFSVLRIKANLYPRSEKIIKHGYHIDYKNIKQKTAVYYVNTNNGKTIFEDGLIIDSIANRLVVFDTDLYHQSTTCTDQKVRCTINFNYMPTPIEEKND
jgi:hypothetical protein